MTIPRNLSFLAQGASASGVLSVPYGGTGVTTLTANYIPYGNGTGAFNSSSNFTYNGSGIILGTTSYLGLYQSGSVETFGQGLTLSSYSYGTAMTFQVNGRTEAMRISTSGGVSIGNTTDPGAKNLSVTGDVIGSRIYSGLSSVSGVLNATATTIYTLPSESTVMITAFIGGSTNPNAFNTVAIAISSGAVTRITTLVTGSAMVLSVSGQNVQVTQTSGVTQAIQFSYVRMY
jgi:hypothetical protein